MKQGRFYSFLQFLKDEEIIGVKKVRAKLANLIAKSRANSLQNIKKVLDRNKFNSKELLAKAGSILTDATSKEVDNMILALNNAGVDSEKVLKKCGALFIKSNSKKVEAIAKLLKEYQLPTSLIEQCTTMLVGNSVKETREILKVLSEDTIIDYKWLITVCPTILALGKTSEIRAIKVELGDSYGELVKACPSILALGKASEIRAIKDALGENYEELVKACPSILAFGKAQIIAELRNALGEGYYKRIIDRCPSLLVVLNKEVVEKLKRAKGEGVFDELTVQYAKKLKNELSLNFDKLIEAEMEKELQKVEYKDVGIEDYTEGGHIYIEADDGTIQELIEEKVSGVE